MTEHKKSTNGVAISFLSSILGLITAAVLYQVKWNFELSSKQTINLWVITLVFLFAIRLYYRVVFIDSFYNSIETKYFRISLFLIIPLSALAGLIWSFFDFGEKVGAIFMIIYSCLLAVFSVCVTSGLTKNKKKRIESFYSIVVDLCTAGFWIYYIYYIIINPDNREISDGLQLIFGAFCIAITWEFSRLYFEPLKNYTKYCLQILKKKTAENRVDGRRP